MGTNFRERGGWLPRLADTLWGRTWGGGARHGRGAAGIGAQAVGRSVGVALFHLYVGGGNAQLLGKDLRVGRLVTLPLRLGAESRDGLAGGMNADLAGVEHLQSQDVEVLGGA